MKREKCSKSGCKKRPIFMVIDGWVTFKLCEAHQNDFPKGRKIRLEPPSEQVKKNQTLATAYEKQAKPEKK